MPPANKCSGFCYRYHFRERTLTRQCPKKIRDRLGPVLDIVLVRYQSYNTGLVSFCQLVEKTGIFRGKNRTGKNSFCRQKIVFVSKNSSCQNFSFFQLKVCHLVHNIFLITCYLFNCRHRIVILLLGTVKLSPVLWWKELPRLKSTKNSTARPRLHPCCCHLSTSDAEPE